jgi:hypothetical protein
MSEKKPDLFDTGVALTCGCMMIPVIIGLLMFAWAALRAAFGGTP